MARLETQIATGSLLDRFPRLSLATDEVSWKETVTLQGPQVLPVSW